MTKATISISPLSPYIDAPEVIETIEIGHVLVAIQQLAKLAELVNENPGQYDEISQMMASIIRTIAVAVMPPEVVRQRIAETFSKHRY